MPNINGQIISFSSGGNGGGSLGPTTPTKFTQGSILFAGADGVLSQNNSQFKWDDTTGAEKLYVKGGANASYAAEIHSQWSGTGPYSSVLLLKSDNPGDYYPTHIRLENTAYGTYGNIGVGPNNGVNFSTNQYNAKFLYGSYDGTLSQISGAAADPTVTAYATGAAKVALASQLAASQTADAYQVRSYGGSTLYAVTAEGGVRFASMADGTAQNDTTYYSTTQSKLCYKDGGGTVHTLY